MERTNSTTSVNLPTTRAGRLAGLVALVSGAGGPMGTAVSRRFLEEGASLGIFDVSERRLKATVVELRELYPDRPIVARRASALVRLEVEVVCEEVTRELGPIDLLANIVGGIRGVPLTQPLVGMNEDRFNSTFDLNLKSIFFLVQTVAPSMLERHSGSIINIASVTMSGDPGQPEYGAAKAAVASLTRALALELAPHVRVNCIAPGLIATSVLNNATSALIEEYVRRTPLRRLGTPKDIADAAVFLASQEASYVTGAILPVSGGLWPHL